MNVGADVTPERKVLVSVCVFTIIMDIFYIGFCILLGCDVCVCVLIAVNYYYKSFMFIGCL